MAEPQPKLGILAGSGTLPVELAKACEATGREYYLLAIEGAADEALPLAHATVRLGAVGEAMDKLTQAFVEELVMAGGIKRPSMASLKPDAAGAKLMARLGLKLFGGDDAVLKALVGFLEEEGFRVVGADEILGGLTAKAQCYTLNKPDTRALAAIALGMRAAKALGAFDIGQAVIVEDEAILAVEGVEGTDALLVRTPSLLREPRRAILVKACKPGQEARADLPAIGPQTVRRAVEVGLSGIAVEAGGALLLEQEKTVALANEHGLFIIGVQPIA